MSVHLKIEEESKGLVATISQRDGNGKLIGDPSVQSVSSAMEARQLAKKLARSLGLRAYGVIDKTKRSTPQGKPPEGPADPVPPGSDLAPAIEEEPPPWLVPGVRKAI